MAAAQNILDVSKVGNSTQITLGGGQPLSYKNVPIAYSFSPDGTVFNIRIGNRSRSCLLTELTLGGSAPANVAGAMTTLSTLFP